MIQFPDGTDRRLHDRWSENLGEAQACYQGNRNEETKAEYLRVLQIFTDLVLRDKAPSLGEAQ